MSTRPSTDDNQQQQERHLEDPRHTTTRSADDIRNSTGTDANKTSSIDSTNSNNASSFFGRVRRQLHDLRPFQFLLKKAFQVCDKNNSGRIGPDEFYVGVLLLHLNLAKYAGPAACYPPSRMVCDQLFVAADSDRNGMISQIEFVRIVQVLLTQVLLRMFVYYAVLILFVPEFASTVVHWTRIPTGGYMEMAAEQTISLLLFFLAIPIVWDWIDSGAERRVGTLSTSSSVTPKTTSLNHHHQQQQPDQDDGRNVVKPLIQKKEE